MEFGRQVTGFSGLVVPVHQTAWCCWSLVPS